MYSIAYIGGVWLFVGAHQCSRHPHLVDGGENCWRNIDFLERRAASSEQFARAPLAGNGKELMVAWWGGGGYESIRVRQLWKIFANPLHRYSLYNLYVNEEGI